MECYDPEAAAPHFLRGGISHFEFLGSEHVFLQLGADVTVQCPTVHHHLDPLLLDIRQSDVPRYDPTHTVRFCSLSVISKIVGHPGKEFWSERLY